MRRDQILPKILRHRDAPGYLGMCREEFNKTVRPFVAEFRLAPKALGLTGTNWMPGPMPTLQLTPSRRRRQPYLRRLSEIMSD